MVQTIVVVVLILADAALLQLNLGARQGPLQLTIPWTNGLVVTPMLLMVAIGMTIVLGWLAAQVDRAILERKIRHRDATLRVMSEELLRLKVATSEQQPSLVDMRTRLDMLDREIRNLQERIRQRSGEPRPREAAEAGTAPLSRA